MQQAIYDKTDKGRDEIATRKYQLQSRLRSLLVLIDGKKTEPELIQKIGGLGLDQNSLNELLNQNFIQRVSLETKDAPPTVAPMTPSETMTATLTDEVPDTISNAIEDEPQTIFEPVADDENWNFNLDVLLVEEEENRESRVDMMKRFLTETIKECLGIKGFFLQRKVQKAKTLNDIHLIRQPYVSAILYAKGKDKAIDMRDQFDQRMYIRFSLEDPEFLEN